MPAAPGTLIYLVNRDFFQSPLLRCFPKSLSLDSVSVESVFPERESVIKQVMHLPADST